MFKWNRVLVAIIGVPLIVFIYTNRTLNGLPLLIFSLLVVGIGLAEFYDMVKISGREVYKNFGIITGILIVLNTYYMEKNLTCFLTNLDIITISAMIMLIYRVLKNQIKGTLNSLAFTILGNIYVAVFFSSILTLYFKEGQITYLSDNKLGLVLILQILVWISDTSAGIVGVSIGRKFFKNGFTEISPKKSVEGAVGSLIFTSLSAVIIAGILFENLTSIVYLKILILGFLVGVIAQIGDLVESLFKRECGVKDSGTILMGHGGVLDRFDSMILVLPFCSFLILHFA